MVSRSSKKKANLKRSHAKKLKLDHIHHIAVSVPNIAKSLEWYTSRFNCEIEYVDETWALLAFANAKLALVIPKEHPAHFALRRPDANKFGELGTHRDGLKSVYISDPFGNTIEILEER